MVLHTLPRSARPRFGCRAARPSGRIVPRWGAKGFIMFHWPTRWSRELYYLYYCFIDEVAGWWWNNLPLRLCSARGADMPSMLFSPALGARVFKHRASSGKPSGGPVPQIKRLSVVFQRWFSNSFSTMASCSSLEVPCSPPTTFSTGQHILGQG